MLRDDLQFPPPRDYMALGLRDLLDARAAYHVHLSHLSHVVGTAVGRYLIHEKDWEATHPPPKPREYPMPTTPRTLFNSVVKEWSWPCVLVFVDEWVADWTKVHGGADQVVPRAFFLPDGRVIPTCVVLVKRGVPEPASPGDLSFPRSYVGGGYLTVSEVQGHERYASIGCLVTDGDLTYALTNRHVTGMGGREIFTMLRGERTKIGVGHSRHVGSRPFSAVYPEWAGEKVELNIDAGLIQIEDLTHWTAQTLGMGPVDDILDLNTDNLSLGLIGMEVCAFGGASGKLEGLIAALFYRYKSMGGTDYVTDFLIRPDRKHGATTHGDSGTLWFWKQGERRRPFAMQWGGHVFIDPSGAKERTGSFALASALSTICRVLDVTVIRDWNSGLPEYWGDVGHYTIGFFACEKLPGMLGTLMQANQMNISYPAGSITSRQGIKLRGPRGFVRLADVPDRVWKIPGGRSARGNSENGNHFADMDKKLPNGPNKGKTLLQLCQDPQNIDPKVWLDYYGRVGDASKGLLPFRVWQFFNEMADAASKQEFNRFVCAAGIAAHYVGDSCQPLHISYLFNGEPVVGNDGKKSKRGHGAHSAYESGMLTRNSVSLLKLIEEELASPTEEIQPPKSGRAAAGAVVKLMTRTFEAIRPMDIVDAYDRGQDLWKKFGRATAKVMADGARTLQAIWRGAWEAGKGDAAGVEMLGEVDPAALIKLYENPEFVPSLRLAEIAAELKKTDPRKSDAMVQHRVAAKKKRPRSVAKRAQKR